MSPSAGGYAAKKRSGNDLHTLTMPLDDSEYFRTDASWLQCLAPELVRRTAAGGGGWADLFFEHTTFHATTLRQRAAGGRISAPSITTHGRVLSGLGLRRVTASQVLYAASDHVSPSELERLRNDLRPWEGRPSIAVQQCRGTATDTDDTLIRLAADAALSLSRCIQEVRVELRHTIRHTAVFVSDGATASDVRARRDLRVEVEANIGGGTLRAYALGGTSGDPAHALSLDPERIAAEAVRRALVLSEARPVPWRPMPVVIAAGWGGVWLHEAVGHLLEADLPDSIHLNIGTQAASGAVTIVDDPTLTDARGSYTDDDEATPASPTVLVKDGTVVNLLADRIGAERMGLAPTGNGRRQDFRFPPLPRMSNLLLSSGEADPNDLPAEVSDGLVVTMIGRGRVFPEEDRYEFDVLEGYRIESGRTTHPVTGIRIGGRLRGALGGVRGVGADLVHDQARGVCSKAGQTVPVSVGMPTVLLDRLDVFPAEVRP